MHIAFDGPVAKALQKVLDVVGSSLVFTERSQADLVVVQDKKSLIDLHTPEKHFAVLSVEDPGQIPKNARWIRSSQVLVPLLSYLKEIQLAEQAPAQKRATRAVPKYKMPRPYPILVIDDKKENRELAVDLLEGNELVVVESYAEAMEVFKSEQFFEIVLTDLYLPMSTYHSAFSDKNFKIGELVPYGLLIMFEATRLGSDVAIVTDANHHADWLSAALDYYREPQLVNGHKVLLVNYLGKRWDEALGKLLKCP